MKNRLIPALGLLVCLAVAPGCARHYVIKLNNGLQITTASKPKLKGASYHFKDAAGRDQSISEGRVREIYPASRAKEEKEFFIRGS